MFQSCLICTDLKDGLQRLVNFVDHLADSGLKEITFFHSVPLWEEGEVPRVDTDKIEEVKALFAKRLENKKTPIKVNIEVPSGEAPKNITKAIEKYQVDFLVKGLPLRRSWTDRIFGSTSVQLMQKVKIPMMIFRPQLISVYREEEIALRCQNFNRYWLIPYIDSKAANYLIDKVKHYASKKPADVTQQCLLLTVIEDTARSPVLIDNYFEEAQQKLNKIKTDLEDLGLEVETLVTKGNPFLETMKVAFDYDISAIAISDDKDSGILDWTVPSYAQSILHRSWFPLLYFPFVK